MSDRLVIDGFVIDLMVELEESADSEATQFPVERGAPMTDHVINKPRTLALTFLVSDTPIGDVFDLRGAGSVPSTEARTFLEELRDSKRPFVVEYGDRRWDDQVFSNLTFSEDAEKVGGLFATASLQRIDVADVRRVVVEGLVPAVASAKLPPKQQTWLCPLGVPISKDEDENRRNGCFLLHQQGTALAKENGDGLSDDETKRLILTSVTGLPLFNGPATTATPPMHVIHKESFFEDYLGIPADYQPPTATSLDDSDSGPGSQREI